MVTVLPLSVSSSLNVGLSNTLVLACFSSLSTCKLSLLVTLTLMADKWTVFQIIKNRAIILESPILSHI